MNNRAPITEAAGSAGWINWFQQVFQCLPWRQAFDVSAELDFPTVLPQEQQSLTATVAGARRGAAVIVTPHDDVLGLVFSGAVTADDTVTVTAKNFSAAGAFPAAQTFRIVVLN